MEFLPRELNVPKYLSCRALLRRSIPTLNHTRRNSAEAKKLRSMSLHQPSLRHSYF
jgi:hypothetical protein